MIAQSSDCTTDSLRFACPTERAAAARIGGWLFRYRGWLPVPFIIALLFSRGDMTTLAWLNGVAAIAVGAVLRLWAVAAAGSDTRRRSRTVHRLVTYGPFAWTRNPLYVANAIIWIGFLVIAGVHWFVPMAIAIFAAEYSAIVRYEEGVLESTFGQRYLEYKASTPRWLPIPPAETGAGPLAWVTAWRSERSTIIAYVVVMALMVAKSRWS
jgi:protein-S-isoprenylcysteine O-methyltransferase Ste14